MSCKRLHLHKKKSTLKPTECLKIHFYLSNQWFIGHPVVHNLWNWMPLRINESMTENDSWAVSQKRKPKSKFCKQTADYCWRLLFSAPKMPYKSLGKSCIKEVFPAPGTRILKISGVYSISLVICSLPAAATMLVSCSNFCLSALRQAKRCNRVCEGFFLLWNASPTKLQAVASVFL